jgi:hypothetical protein
LTIPDNDMRVLWQREQNGEFVFNKLLATGRVEFKLGSVVLIVSGALIDRKGTIIKKLNGSAYKVDLDGSGLVATAKAEQLQLAEP